MTYENKPNGFQITFERDNATYKNTGWYGCLANNSNFTRIFIDYVNADWIYVFVRCKKK